MTFCKEGVHVGNGALRLIPLNPDENIYNNNLSNAVSREPDYSKRALTSEVKGHNRIHVHDGQGANSLHKEAAELLNPSSGGSYESTSARLVTARG